jgi:CheY-like chemotaxis protein
MPVARPTLLLVEDHEDSRNTISHLLKTRNYSVVTAPDFDSAVKLLTLIEFDLLLTDIGLPDGSGIDLFKECRRIKPIPAIAITGHLMHRELEQCAAVGFDRLLGKPFNPSRLLEYVHELTPNSQRFPPNNGER